MKVTLKSVGRAYLDVDFPDGSEELVCSMRARLPCDFGDFLSDLGIQSIDEKDFYDHLNVLDVESFKVEPDKPDSSSPGSESASGGNQ